MLSKLIPRAYVLQGMQSLRSRENILNHLLTHQKLPENGLDDQTIEYFLHQFSLMDSNNFNEMAGMGEREGRVVSALVKFRHFNFSHGIGRSGDIVEVQPKAAGSSIVYKLTNKLVSDALYVSGIKTPLNCIVFPLATGMTMSLALMTLKLKYPGRTKVIWSRIDQKSCLKAIALAGLTPIVVEPKVAESGELTTDVERISSTLLEEGDNVLCVLSTTSCFAPRQPDQIDKIAQLCSTFNVGHLINNAYGVQCEKIAKLIDRAFLKGRVDGGKFEYIFL